MSSGIPFQFFCLIISNFSIKGNPVLFDWEGTFFEGFITDTENGRKMVLGIVMKNIRIDEIVEKIFKKKILQTSWMSDLTASKYLAIKYCTSNYLELYLKFV